MAAFSTMWEAQRRYFSHSCDVALVDNRGIAQSGSPPGLWRIEDMAEDVACVLDHLGWDSVHLVGHSLGQLIVNAAAHRLGGRVRSLAWISPVSVAPLRGTGCLSQMCAPLGIWRCSGLTKECDLLMACDPHDRVEASLAINWPSAWLERDAHDGGPGTNRDAVLRDMVQATRGQGRVPEATMLKQALAWLLHWPALSGRPTLIIAGEEDALVAAQRVRSRAIAAHERGQPIEFLAVSGAGHSCQAQCAIAVNCALEAFVMRVQQVQDDAEEASETTRLSGGASCELRRR